MKPILMALAACLFICFSPAAHAIAYAEPGRSIISRLAAGSSEAGGTFEVRWDETTHTPALLAGILSKPSKHTPAWIALEFVNKTKRLYGVKSPHSSMRVAKISEVQNAGVQVRLVHLLYGTPVWGDELRIDIDRDGIVRRVEGRIYPNLAKATFNRPRHAAVNQAEAVRVAAAGTGIASTFVDATEVESFYLPTRAGIPLVYFVTFQSNRQKPIYVMVHALTGKIIAIPRDSADVASM